MSRSVGIVVAVLCVSLGAGFVRAEGTIVQPEPPYPASETPPDIVTQYRASQSDGENEARIRATVDTYFALLLMSLTEARPLDFGFLIDRSTVSGENLYRYELGRLEYTLAWWECSGHKLLDYEYKTLYQDVAVDESSASVAMVAVITLWQVAGRSDMEVRHELALTLTPEGWKLVHDVYEDPFRKGNPLGTDFSEKMPPPDGQGQGELPPLLPPGPQVDAAFHLYIWIGVALTLAAGSVFLLRLSGRRRDGRGSPSE